MDKVQRYDLSGSIRVYTLEEFILRKPLANETTMNDVSSSQHPVPQKANGCYEKTYES